MDGDNPDEDFPPTNGRAFGTLAVVIGIGVGVLAVVEGGDVLLPGLAVAVFLVGVAWAALLRPRVSIRGDDLVLRNMLSTVSVPLAAIEEVVVRQFLAVRAGERRFTSPAVGRPRRQMSREDRAGSSTGDYAMLQEGQAFAVFVQERIRQRATEARERLGIRVASAEQDALADQVRREPAVAELAVLLVSSVALVVALVV